MELSVIYDKSADAATVYFRDIERGGVAETLDCGIALLARDREGRIIKVAVMNASRLLPRELLDGAHRLPPRPGPAPCPVQQRGSQRE